METDVGSVASFSPPPVESSSSSSQQLSKAESNSDVRDKSMELLGEDMVGHDF